MKKLVFSLSVLLLFLPFQLSGVRRVSVFMFQPEWYVGGDFGGNVFVSEGFQSYNLAKSIGFSSRFFVGYNFTPYSGLKCGVETTFHNWPDIRLGSAVQSFNSQHILVDYYFNLSNALSIYSLKRKIDFSLFIGTGLSYRNKANFTTDFFSTLFRAGSQIDYHLTHHLDVNILGEINIFPDNYNNFVAEIPVDINPSVMLGFTYHFRGK